MFRISLNPGSLFPPRTIAKANLTKLLAYLENTLMFPRNCAWLPVLFSVLVLINCFSPDIAAQAKIVLITKDKAEINSTKEVTCVRKKSRPPVFVKMSLQLGDRLISDTRPVKVKFNCQGADFIVSAPFDVRFQQPKGPGCHIGYSSSGGRLSAKTHGFHTHIQSGVAGMVSRYTQYEIRETRMKPPGLLRYLPFLFRPRVTREWLVFEGKVDLKLRGFSETIRQGQKAIAFGSRVPMVVPITAEDIDAAADVYAETDVSQMPTSNPQEREDAFVTLKAVHRAILAEPQNPQHQIELKRVQESLGIPTAPPSPGPQGTPNDINLATPTEIGTTQIFRFRNNCRKPHKFRFTPQNQSLAYRPPVQELALVRGGSSDVRFEVDTVGKKPGDYQGELIVECLDCKTERGCGPTSKRFPFNLQIK